MPLNNLYYSLKPFLPRRVQLALRRIIVGIQSKGAQSVWPVNEAAGKVPPGWQGWPGGKKMALVITHDLETQRGLPRCRLLAELDMKYGFKSAFNIVPCRYNVPVELRKWLVENGFEVGMHDYNHDGKLYKSKAIFDNRAEVINRYIKEWNVTGFRSAAMHHNLEWISNLNIQYDCSTFDTDPFEPQSDGVNTIFPFWYQHPDCDRGFVEIPYTLPQDFTLFVIKKEKDCRVWKEKLKWLAEKGGMATVIVHPDYINFGDTKKRSDEYSFSLYSEFLQHIKTEYRDQYWNALPNEIALFIKNLSEK
jgi:peptidoglycan/xylan/chitin deacetylase (PgdA/CDA1 family)